MTPSPARSVTTTAIPSVPEVEPRYVYYRLEQAGHVELVVDEVRLDATGTRCFQAKRRMFGAFEFGRGEHGAERSTFADELEAVVHSWKEFGKKGIKPVLVLHGHASTDDAEDAKAAQDLSRKRAETVKGLLVAGGVPPDRLEINAHGWHLSPAPLEPNDALKPNRRVEISADSSSPSEAKVTEGKAMAERGLKALQQRVRALEGKPGGPSVSLHAPRVVFAVGDAGGKLEVSFEVGSAPADVVALHQYFLTGLSGGCTYDVP